MHHADRSDCRPLSAQSVWEVIMWNPATSTSIEEVVTEANNLNELLDLMHLCFKK
jgi:hypothetical protein